MIDCPMCDRRHRTFRAAAKCRWSYAVVDGQGPWAVVALCPPATVHLFADQLSAEESKGRIDRLGCGHRCGRRHFVKELP